jgi:hypothetical protein
LIVKPQKLKIMEKLILLGVAFWLNFVLTDGFPPEKPVVKPFIQKSEISKPDVNHPQGAKCKWVKSSWD